MNDLESRDQIIADLSERLDRGETVIVELDKALAESLHSLVLRAETAEAEVERLKAEADDMSFRLGYAEAEVERLKAHTWQQERDDVVAWLERKIRQYIEEGKTTAEDSTTRKLRVEHIIAMICVQASIEKGEHWPKGETLSVVPVDECGCDDRFYCSACQEFYPPNATTHLRHEPLCDRTTTTRVVCENCRVKGRIERGKHWPEATSVGEKS